MLYRGTKSLLWQTQNRAAIAHKNPCSKTDARSTTPPYRVAGVFSYDN